MKRRHIVTMIMAAMMSMAMAMTAFAGSWQKNDTGWWWDNGNGTWPANGWQWIDGNNDGIAECYYFDANGYMLANAVTPDGYKVNMDGAWIENGTVKTQTSGQTAQGQESRPSSAEIIRYLTRGKTNKNNYNEWLAERYPIDLSKPEWKNGVTNIQPQKNMFEARGTKYPENGGYFYLDYNGEDFQAIALNKDGYLMTDTVMPDGHYVNKYGIVEIDGREVRHNTECIYLAPSTPVSDRNHADYNAIRYQDWGVAYQWDKYIFPCGELIYNHFRGCDRNKTQETNTFYESINNFGVCVLHGREYPSYRENPNFQ